MGGSFLFLLLLLLKEQNRSVILAGHSAGGKLVRTPKQQDAAFGNLLLEGRNEDIDSLKSKSWQVIFVRPMVHISVSTIFFLLCFSISSFSQAHGIMADNKVLNVGEELLEETLPLKMGSRFYELRGLKSSAWYEVKISYPASIPSSFTIQLKKDKVDTGVNLKRKLLNTEKLIFKVDDNDLRSNQDQMYILVSVEPAGVVAIPHASERDFVIFNIVCDELLLGIPHKAWWVVGFVILCLMLAFSAAYFLPSFLRQSSADPTISKDS